MAGEYEFYMEPRPLGDKVKNNSIVNELMSVVKENGELVGSPFVIGSNLCAIVKKGAASGGKSRAKNSYKKYMKKTRKRN